jgi:protein-S-isoprenylcysteine O-methyltransferase Ste14
MGKFLFSIVSYATGISSIAAFFWYIQFEVDRNLAAFSWSTVCLNILLFLLFPLQHSVFPRQRVKSWIQQHFSFELERPLYVLTSGIAMWILLIGWRPFGPMIFYLSMAFPLKIAFYLALLLIILCTVALDHSSMFGLKQGYYAWKQKQLHEEGLKTNGLFGIVRHPLTSLLIVVLWAHASMSAGRLLLNILFTAYAIAGTVFEEKDLIRKFGKEYQEYKNQVPAFVPFWK